LSKLILLFIPVFLFAGAIRDEVVLDPTKLQVHEFQGYLQIEYPGAVFFGPAGSPMLPRLSYQILLPSGAKARAVKVVNVETVKIRIKGTVYPMQKPVPISYKVKSNFVEPDIRYYSLQSYPEDFVTLTGTGNMSGYSIAGIILNPVIYRPLDSEIEFVTRIIYEVEYDDGISYKATEKQRGVFGEIVKRLVRNPEVVDLYAPERQDIKDGDTVEMVIITSSTFAPYFDSLRIWKEERGIRTRIVTLDQIYASYAGRDNPEKIRNFIKDYYTNKGLIYLLLGGQADHENGQAIVPRRDAFYLVSGAGYYDDEDTIPCDLYYSDLDGSWNADNDNIWGELSDSVDMYPDVIVGRFPVRTVDEINNLIRKIKVYESNPPSGYLTNIVLPAQLLWSQYPYYGDSVNNRIANLTPTPPWNDIKLYQSMGNLSTTNFINAVNSGVGFAHYASHGNETSASFVSVSDFSSMTNGSKLGIHNAICCFTGAIDEVAGGDCFAESLVNLRNGGAIATIMNTRYGWGYPPDLGPSERIDSTFYYHIFRNEIWTLGEAHILSLAQWVPTAVAEGSDGVYRWCIYELWIFGDPSLQVWTDNPTVINASYPNNISVGMSSLTVNTDAPGSVVALSKNGTLVGRGVANSSGTAVVPISGALIPGDTVKVIVRAKNRLPHTGSLFVISSGPYVYYLSSNIQEISGNGNGRVNPGETIRLYVMLKNYGQDGATNVNATLSTTNTNVTITDNSAAYGDIPAGDSTYGSDYFEFNVSYSALDQEVIPFTLNITSNEGSWSANFSYTVYAPLLSYQRVQVDDSQGNGNGVIDPGETVILRVYAKNTGHEDAPSVVGKITCQDTRVVINNNNLSMGDIPQGGNGYADYSVTFGSNINIGEIIPFGLRLTSSNLVFLDSFKVFVGVQYYATSFEGEDYRAWTFESPWARRNTQAYDGSYSLGTGPYPNNMDASLISPAFIVTGQCTLSFYEWSYLENNYDYGYVEYRLNGGSWVQLDSRTGDRRSWQRTQYVISGNPGDTLRIRFRATSDGSVTYDGWYIDSLRLGPVVFMPQLSYTGYSVNEVYGNGNGYQEPGELVNLYLTLTGGLRGVDNVVGYLRALDGNSDVIDSVSNYGNIGAYASSSGDGFQVYIHPSASIQSLRYLLRITGTGYSESLEVVIPAGRYVGPCNYGYRAFSDLSPYSIRPTFNWIEIKNIGTQIASSSDDVYQLVSLPFTFKFFGQNKSSITVSSNGWVGFGSYTSSYFTNAGIPNSQAPNDIIAIIWDDLNPSATGSGKIYYYYDAANHIFIVEYDSVYHYGTTLPTKAQVILYDPAYYPTPTGDGNIVIQFLITPGQTDYTCGIENSTGDDGIQYYYDGTYAQGADSIVGGRAILFTTDTTGLVSGVSENLPQRMRLLGLSSNPLKGVGFVAFEVAKRSNVTLDVLDIQGRVVKTLAKGEYDRGYYRVKFDGESLPQGIYFVRLRVDGKDEVSKFLLVK